jgi:hypothetical protein
MGLPALRRPAFVLAVGGVLLALTAPVAAQPDSGLKPVPRAIDTTQQQRIRNMREGREPVNKEDLDVLAKFIVYRLTYPQAYNPKDPGYGQNQAVSNIPIQEINKLVQFGNNWILPYPTLPNRPNEIQLQYSREFAKLMVERLKEVLTHREPIVRTNAAWLLGLLGRSGAEELADVYVEILTTDDERRGGEPQKYYALEGLRYLLAIRTDDQVPAGTVFKDPARYRKVVAALIKFINRKPTYAADAPPEQIEGFRWVRREAVKALAQVRVSVVRDPQRPDGKVDSMPAAALLKVAVRDGLTPEPSLSERTEAVIGFCNMATDTELELDYAVYHVGAFLQELALYRRNGAEQTTFPWKVSAARLALALEAWQREVSNLRSGRGGAKVTELAERAKGDVLGPLERSETAALNPDNLQGWLQANQPKSASLIRGQADSKLQLGRPPQFAPAATEDEKKKQP